MSNVNNRGNRNGNRGRKRARGNDQPLPQPAQKKQRPTRQNRKRAGRGSGNGPQAGAAAAYATEQVGHAPKVTASRESCRVTHREFIGNVTGSVAFTLSNTLAINPGIAATFPWLSVIAQNWETYRFRRLRLCYYTRTGTNVPGSVIMAHDSDASDIAPASEQVMTSYEGSVEDAPWKDIMMAFSLLGMNDIGPRKFVRTGPLAANQDIKLYDSGNAYVATVDGTAVNWGKLWLEYDIDFYTPQLPPNGGAIVAGGIIQGGGTLTAANPIGTVPVVDVDNVSIAVDALSVITFAQIGTFLVSASLAGTVLTALTMTGTAGAAVATDIAFLVNGAGTLASMSYRVIVTVPGSTVSLAATATTVTGSAFFVASAPANTI